MNDFWQLIDELIDSWSIVLWMKWLIDPINDWLIDWLIDYRFCAHLKSSENIQILMPYLPKVMDCLLSMATQSTDDVLALVLESLRIVMSVRKLNKRLLFEAVSLGVRKKWFVQNLDQFCHKKTSRINELCSSNVSGHFSKSLMYINTQSSNSGECGAHYFEHFLKAWSIDRLHKWRPKNYSFVFVLIKPTSLALKEHFFCILSVPTRLVSLIRINRKEYFFRAPFMQSVYEENYLKVILDS